MTDYKVIIPEEAYSLVKFRQEDMPGIAFINASLKSFENHIVFPWHLSLMLNFTDLIDNGMPSSDERGLVDPFFDKVEMDLKGDSVKPNGLFLARITWNGTREFIWRIHEPEIANKYLRKVIRQKKSPRPFDFRMDHDPEWKLAQWHLKNAQE